MTQAVSGLVAQISTQERLKINNSKDFSINSVDSRWGHLYFNDLAKPLCDFCDFLFFLRFGSSRLFIVFPLGCGSESCFALRSYIRFYYIGLRCMAGN